LLASTVTSVHTIGKNFFIAFSGGLWLRNHMLMYGKVARLSPRRVRRREGQSPEAQPRLCGDECAQARQVARRRPA